MPPRRHMRDACSIGTYADITVGGRPQESWQYAASTRCRFSREDSRETMDSTEVAHTDIKIAIPAGADVTHAGRIKLTKRNRTTLDTPEFYEVVGDAWFTKGNREIVLACRSIKAGAV